LREIVAVLLLHDRRPSERGTIDEFAHKGVLARFEFVAQLLHHLVGLDGVHVVQIHFAELCQKLCHDPFSFGLWSNAMDVSGDCETRKGRREKGRFLTCCSGVREDDGEDEDEEE